MFRSRRLRQPRPLSGRLLSLLTLMLALLVSPALVVAQNREGDVTSRLLMTRPELQELVSIYETASLSRSARSDERALSRSEVELIRARLDAGDFQTGDQIELAVEGEPELTGTFTVVADREGPALRLPVIGTVSLRGVLRSEVEPHLRKAVSGYIHDPVVYATALIRVSILDGVASPGFYPVPAEALVTDLLMVAGGPTNRAKLDKIRVERGRERIWMGDDLQVAIIEGRTLDQLSLRAGDRIVVPQRGDWSWLGVAHVSAIVVSSVIARIHLF